MVGVVVLGAAVVVAVVIALVRRLRDGRLRPARVEPGRTPEGPDSGVTLLAELGIAPGDNAATLVQFSTAFCQPCVATRRILDQVAGMIEGVGHIEVDAESHLDLVRRLGIMRTPTVLILDRHGNETKRASGTPRKVDIIAAVGPLVMAP